MACCVDWAMSFGESFSESFGDSITDRLIMTGGPGEILIALAAGDRIQEFLVDRFTAMEGDILLGRVRQRAKDLTSAFIDIGEERDGFVAKAGTLREGGSVLVQVLSAARGDKGASLTLRPSISGQWLVYSATQKSLQFSRQITDPAVRQRCQTLLSPLLAGDEGLTIRSAAPLADDSSLTGEFEQLRESWQSLARDAATKSPPARLLAPSALEKLLRRERDVARIDVAEAALLPEARRLFAGAAFHPQIWQESGAADALDQALEPIIALPGGGRLIIEESAAATLIDIDGAGLTAEAANRAALIEIARQIRLRGLAGHILIDLIQMPGKAALPELLEGFRRLLALDPTPSQIVGTTRLGMVEMIRERRQPSLREWFLAAPRVRRNERSLAFAALRAVLDAALRHPAGVALVAAPDIARYLDSRPDLLAEMKTRLGRSLTLRQSPMIDEFEVVPLS